MIGQTFGDYRILEKRGEGGMGMFFKAVDERLDRIVGLKTLRAELLADPMLLDRLQTEAKSLARLDHQNIARLLHYLVANDQHFIVMEYVDGFDLAEIVKKSGLLPFDRLGTISGEVCAAISYAHAKGVVHRDLKPSNILVSHAGRVKVTDFGIAKILGASSQTRTGTATGSLPYMAPEQIRAGEVDGRTDIYQLGVMLFELAAGRRPFASDSEYEMMRMHLEDAPPMPSSVNGRVSPALDAVIVKALAKLPADRFQTADEFSAALLPALAGEADEGTSYRVPAPAPPTSVERPSPEDQTILPQKMPSPPTASKRVPSPPTARPMPARPAPTPPEEPTSDGSRRMWPWVAGLAIVAVAVVGYLLWPKHAVPPTTVVVTPDTTTVVTPAKVEPVQVSVQATMPERVPRGRVRTITLTRVHPDSGTAVDTITASGRTIQTDFSIAPSDSFTIALRGYDPDGKKMFEGTVVRSAPAGSRLFVDVPLTSTYVMPVDSTRDTTTTKIKPPPPVAANLLINVEPFTERDRIDEVLLDERPISGAFPLKQTVTPGRHKIRWRIGGSRWTDTVTVGQTGAPVEKHLFVGSSTGRLTIAAQLPADAGFADIWVDGVATGQGTPWRLESVPVGPHEVAVKHERYVMRGGAQIIVIQPNHDQRVDFEMVPR
ncbi:MAG: protein kinase [candidate division Zixibacteria bacterium]|nr:protein kinase [candidate division Zixibacteria bacterium]